MFTESKTTLHFNSAAAFLETIGIYFQFFFKDLGDKITFYDMFIRRIEPSLFNVTPYTVNLYPEKRLTTFAVKYHDLVLHEEDKEKPYFSLLAKEGLEKEAEMEAGYILDISNHLTGQMKALTITKECTPMIKSCIGDIKIKIPNNKRYPFKNVTEFNAQPGYLAIRFQCGWCIPPKDGSTGKYGVTFALSPWKTKEETLKKRALAFEVATTKRQKSLEEGEVGTDPMKGVLTQDCDGEYVPPVQEPVAEVKIEPVVEAIA